MTPQSPEIETTPCPLCHSTDYDPYHSGSDYFMHLPGTFHLVRCQNCTLLYQNPRPSSSVINQYYPDEYGSYATAQQGIRTRRGLLLSKVIYRGLNKRCKLIDQHQPQKDGQSRKLLDIGCAAGLFLEVMQQYPGWQVEGVEPNKTAAKATSERLGIQVFQGLFEEAHYPDASFDAVTLWDVLEHLYDPIESLKELHRILKPGGLLFVRVPNGASYVRSIFRRYWVGYDLPRHMTIFTPTTLKQAFELTGFNEPIRTYTSGSYLSTLHSMRFALDDGRMAPERAAKLHKFFYHPIMRAVALLPFISADKIAGGSNLEVLVRASNEAPRTPQQTKH